MLIQYRVAYFGVMEHDGRYIVLGFNTDCRPIGEPVGHFDLGVTGMLAALAMAAELDGML